MKPTVSPISGPSAARASTYSCCLAAVVKELPDIERRDVELRGDIAHRLPFIVEAAQGVAASRPQPRQRLRYRQAHGNGVGHQRLIALRLALYIFDVAKNALL